MMLRLMAFTLALGVSTAAAAQGQYVSGAPLPAESVYRPFVRQQIGTMLRDPYSAQYEFERPYQVTCRARLFDTPDRWRGWAMRVLVNARNAYGAYTGAEEYYVLFVNDGRTDGIEVHIPTTFRYGTCRAEVWDEPSAAAILAAPPPEPSTETPPSTAPGPKG